MKTLFLLRHAKSSWKDKTLTDFERPLNSRGRKAAETMSAFFKQEKVNPDLILSSCATRARQTIDIIVRSARLRTDLRFDERIYEASISRLLEVVTQIEKSARSVLIVGHNPGLEELLSALTTQTETMPTAALAKISFKISNWNNAVKGGALEWVVRPKEWEKA
jgi:phosphohistidine phosphatase